MIRSYDVWCGVWCGVWGGVVCVWGDIEVRRRRTRLNQVPMVYTLCLFSGTIAGRLIDGWYTIRGLTDVTGGVATSMAEDKRTHDTEEEQDEGGRQGGQGGERKDDVVATTTGGAGGSIEMATTAASKDTTPEGACTVTFSAAAVSPNSPHAMTTEAATMDTVDTMEVVTSMEGTTGAEGAVVAEAVSIPSMAGETGETKETEETEETGDMVDGELPRPAPMEQREDVTLGQGYEGCIRDVERVWQNAYLYNDPATMPFRIAEYLQTVFRITWAQHIAIYPPTSEQAGEMGQAGEVGRRAGQAGQAGQVGRETKVEARGAGTTGGVEAMDIEGAQSGVTSEGVATAAAKMTTGTPTVTSTTATGVSGQDKELDEWRDDTDKEEARELVMCLENQEYAELSLATKIRLLVWLCVRFSRCAVIRGQIDAGGDAFAKVDKVVTKARERGHKEKRRKGGEVTLGDTIFDTESHAEEIYRTIDSLKEREAHEATLGKVGGKSPAAAVAAAAAVAKVDIVAVRTCPLGRDRDFNRYWHFDRDSTKGVLFVEDGRSGAWRAYTHRDQLEELIDSLDERGAREKALLRALTLRRAMLSAAMEAGGGVTLTLTRRSRPLPVWA